MIDETTVPSAPKAADMTIAGGQVFERLRRENVGGRRCAPCDNSWVAVDRIVFEGRLGLLFHRNHPCSPGQAIKQDLVDRDLRAVGLEVLGRDVERDGQVNVITADCPGIRLRALVEALGMSDARLPHAVAWHIISRTAELHRAFREVGVQPLDTFVGFDGSLHLFPTMPACWQSEMPSFMGDEVFNPLLVDESVPSLVQLVCGRLPTSVFGFAEVRAALAERGAVSAEPAIPEEVRAFLDGPRTTADAVPILASLMRQCFPRAHARHRWVYQSLGRDLDTDGLAREAVILGRARRGQAVLTSSSGSRRGE
ncbi:MAG: hypothetical protein QM820_45395 [Minicystis sp.]